MALVVGGIKIDPQGQTLAVNITIPSTGQSVVAYTATTDSVPWPRTASGAAAAFPVTISSPTTFYVTAATDYLVSAKVGSQEVAGGLGQTRTVNVGGQVVTLDPAITNFPDEGVADIGTFLQGSSVTVNPLQFGAVGGNEALDTAAFEAAITAAGVNGTINVSWPPSKLAYIITPSTLAMLDGLNIQAQGWLPKIQKGTGTGPILSALGKTGPRIAGLHFLGSSSMAGPPTSLDFGLQIQGCTDAVVEDNEVEGMAWDAISFDTWSNVRPRIRRNRVHDCANHAITCTSGKGYNGAPSGSTDVECDDNTIWNIGNFGIINGYNRTPGGGAIDIGVDATLLTVAAPGVNGDNVVPGDATVGAVVQIPGAGPAGATLTTTIASYVDNQHVHITDAASTTVTGQTVTIYSWGQRYKVRRNSAYNVKGPAFQFFVLDGLYALENRADGGAIGATGHLVQYCRHSVIEKPFAHNINPTNSYGAAIYLVNVDDITINDPDVFNIGNSAGGAGQAIRYLSSGSPVTGATGLPVFINRPKVYKTASHGIEVDGPDCHIDEHSIEGAGTLGSSGWGILLNACARPHITRGRRTEGNVSGGITASGAVDSARVSKNEISNRGAVGTNPPAVNISGTTTNSHFVDNDIHDLGTGTRYSGTGGSGTVIRDDIQEGTLPAKAVAGAVSDGSFTGGITPISGALGVDTTNSKLYVRVGSTWKSVAVA